MGKIMKIDSISQIYAMIGYEKPRHPLISLIEPRKATVIPVIDRPVAMDFYSISLKNGHECKFKYGRENYDFQEGTLVCVAPGQVIEPIDAPKDVKDVSTDGWMLLFHPDLIRKAALARKMGEYTFFSYDSREALHLSDQERKTMNHIVKNLEHEYSQNLDNHSQALIMTHLELLLNYCQRFYSRQFITRTHVTKDVVARFEDYLKVYFDSSKPETQGLPTVKACAREMGYSPNYLSDLLRQATGKNAQEHIHHVLIEKAKNLLLGTEEPVYRIAYALGFEYPQHFSKLFKNKIGVSPAEYRH